MYRVWVCGVGYGVGKFHRGATEHTEYPPGTNSVRALSFLKFLTFLFSYFLTFLISYKTQGIASLQSILKANTRQQHTDFYPVSHLAFEGMPSQSIDVFTSVLHSSVFRLPTSVSRLRSPVSGLPSSVSRLPSPVSGLRSPVFRLPSPVFRLPSSDFGLRSSDFRLPKKRGTRPSRTRPPQWE